MWLQFLPSDNAMIKTQATKITNLRETGVMLG